MFLMSTDKLNLTHVTNISYFFFVVSTIAGFDDGSETPKCLKDELGHSNQQMVGIHELIVHCYGIQGCLGTFFRKQLGSKIVGNRWVYSVKQDVTLRSRSVAQGFTRVRGNALTDSHAPGMTNIAFRVAMIVNIIRKRCTKHAPIQKQPIFIGP
jgi:hypothetical protein